MSNTMKAPLYLALVSLLQRMKTLSAPNSGFDPARRADMAGHCRDEALRLVSEHLPSGSGFDNGTRLSVGRCWITGSQPHPDRLVFLTDFHHMDEHGGYDGWTNHEVTIQPAWGGVSIRVNGRNRNDIKDLIHEAFQTALTAEVEYYPMPEPKP